MSDFNLGNLGGQLNEQYLGMVRKTIQEQVPTAIYNEATQMNLVNTALDAVVRNAVSQFASQVLSTNLGHQASPLLSQIPGLLNLAHQVGLDQMLAQALKSTNLDEQLRDAVIEGFSRYLRDNAGHLAQLALQALVDNVNTQQQR